MTEKKTPDNNENKPEKLKIIGPKQAVIYWIVAVICVITVIFLYKYNQNNYEKSRENTSSSASVTYEFSNHI